MPTYFKVPLMLILGICSTSFVFMSRLKTQWLYVKMAMFFSPLMLDNRRIKSIPIFAYNQ